MPAHRSYSFGEYTLDLGRGALLKSGADVRLRPKSFQLLRLLVERHGQLVTKDELLDAVWGRTVVTDGAITQCLIDVRRAIGDESQRVIRTVPRRGYIFDVQVVESDGPLRGQIESPGTAEATPRPSRTRWPRAAMVPAAIVALVAVAIWWNVRTRPADDAVPAEPVAARPLDKSIAVLPFVNLSPEPENAYFADGLHEEILSTLARAGGLRVISRTSVQEYRETQRNLREIAQALDVSLILEGTVRREGDDLRLSLQLIDGRTDEHLWAGTYDRKFENALHLQQAVAEEVVAAVGAELSPAEQRSIEQAAPANPEAYARYIHARALFARPRGEEDLHRADALLGEALQLDPDFALAYATRAKVRISGAVHAGGGTPQQRASARADVERALALQPNLSDALAAKGLYETYLALDPERGLQYLERALAVAPNDVDTLSAAGLTLRRLGRFDDALERFDRAAALSPAQWELRLEFAGTLMRLGRHAEADHALRAMVDRDPTLVEPRVLLRFNHFLATGQIAGWREEYERLTAVQNDRVASPWERYWLLAATGDVAGQIELFEDMVSGAVRNELGGPPELKLAMAHIVAGHPERARPYLLTVAEPRTDGTMDAYVNPHRAMALELLGRSEEAVQVADSAVELVPATRDAINGPETAILRAWVLIHSGIRADEGYAELERLVGGIDQPPRWLAVTVPWLLLADDARTQQIIRSKFPAPH